MCIEQSPISSSMPSAKDALPFPNRPSIAVLPFTNMSGDPEQEYFSDGITEDIITDLSKVGALAVTARNTTFALKVDGRQRSGAAIARFACAGREYTQGG